jgi:putative Holliday junction resolvase
MTIPNDGNTLHKIKKLIEEHRIFRLVVGYPWNLKGQKNPSTKKVDDFLEKLSHWGLEIIRWDERLTTSTAVELLHQVGVKPFKDKGRIDRCAATVILQHYLDSKK